MDFEDNFLENINIIVDKISLGKNIMKTINLRLVNKDKHWLSSNWWIYVCIWSDCGNNTRMPMAVKSLLFNMKFMVQLLKCSKAKGGIYIFLIAKLYTWINAVFIIVVYS